MLKLKSHSKYKKKKKANEMPLEKYMAEDKKSAH